MQLVNEVVANTQVAAARRRRRWSFLAGGSVLAVASALYPVTAMVVIGPASIPLWMFDKGPHPLEVAASAVLVVLTMVAATMLASVLTRQKAIVLYLRRFREPDVAAAMSVAIETGLGRHYRVLTLDDARFIPLDVPRRERWLARIVPPLPLVILGVLTIAAIWISASLFNRFGLSLSGVGVAGAFVFPFFMVLVAPFL